MQRFHGESIADAGLYLGLGSAVGGFIGIVLGGVVADHFRAKTVNARLYVGLAVPALAVPFALRLFVYRQYRNGLYLQFSLQRDLTSMGWLRRQHGQ